MSEQNKNFYLPERCLIKISGDDAESFMQTLVTQDVAGLKPDKLIYACLLTPQGRFLHDFFIFKDDDVFYLECEAARRDDLVRRLKIFKLRSKVVMEDTDFAVYAHLTNRGGANYLFKDPRLEAMGYRGYLPANKPVEAGSSANYKDHRIRLGVPEGSIDIKPEVDTLADVNLDKLQAVSWTKGCFVGQEVAARMENRGLVKKRMMIVSGNRLAAGETLSQNGHAVGEIRSVNSTATEGLAILKLSALEKDLGPLTQPDGAITAARLPDWLKLHNT
jgi:hypothetical protein